MIRHGELTPKTKIIQGVIIWLFVVINSLYCYDNDAYIF